MYGVVSLLDENHEALVESLWTEFKARFGVHGVHMTPIPHFSYHVAESYDMNLLEDTLRLACRGVKPFSVRTNGLGIFTGQEPVLYIPVRIDQNLISLHNKVWENLAAIALKPSQHYHPDGWTPHITLTHRDVNHDLLPEVIHFLSARDFSWEIMVDNLTLLGNEPGEGHTVQFRVPFGG